MDYLALAIPLFLFFIGLEYVIARYQDRNVFSFEDTASNLSVGFTERLLDIFISGSSFFIYSYLYNRFALFEIESNILTWLCLLMIADFIWYWYHRLGHQINLFWSAHVVHHQSEEFNFSVAARITIFQSFIHVAFWSLLPIIGFKAEIITTMLLIHGSYSFFTHTQMVGKLGILELVFVTPSHHRVHHACNAQYLDKNYGDILIIWDKIFGTFEEEKEEPVYGLAKQLKSQNFLWQHFHFLAELIYAVKSAPGFSQKFKLIFGKPEKISIDFRNQIEEKLKLKTSSKGTLSNKLKNIIILEMVLFGVILVFLVSQSKFLSSYSLVIFCFIYFLSMIHIGGLLSKQNYVFHIEILRFFLLLLFFASFSFYAFMFFAAFFLFILPSNFEKLRNIYMTFLIGKQGI